MKFFFYLLIVIANIRLSLCAHFFGGTISWKAVDPTTTSREIDVLFQYRFYWNRTRYNCDSNTVATGGLIGDTDTIDCKVGCSTNNFKIDSKVNCTDFSVLNNWSGGQRSSIQKLYINESIIEASFEGTAWITLNSGSSNWAIRVKLNLNKRSDNNRINTPPVVLVSPIVNLKLNCNNTIKIATTDSDGDRVKCRWASGTSECGGVCNAVPGSILDEDKCTLSFRPTTTGYYAVALQIEDYADKISTTQPLSSIPVQFLLKVQSKPCNSTSEISFNDITFKQDSCINVQFNETINGKIVVYSTSNVTEITTLSPSGLIKSNIDNYNGNSSLFYVNITWTPTDPSQKGSNLFCFQAVNIDDDTTDMRCVTFVVGAQSPIFTNPSPTGLIDSNVNIFSISSVNVPIKKTINLKYIKIYDKNNQEVIRIESKSTSVVIIDESTLVFKVNYNFTKGETYHVLFDEGTAVSTKYCGIDSVQISDRKYWEFTIKTDQIITTLSTYSTSTNTNTNLNSSSNTNTSCKLVYNYNWYIISLILIGILAFLLLLLLLLLCFLLGYLRRKRKEIKKICNNKEPIQVKSKNDVEAVKRIFVKRTIDELAAY